MVRETLQQKTTHKGRENRNVQNLQRQEVNEESVWNPGKQIQGPTRH